MKDRVLHKFGPFTLDPVAKVLFRDGEPVQLTRKAVETLLVLVENAGRVLTKEEIMRAVWPDRVVDEANLAQNIAVIRKALAAEKGSPASIETFPGRGYRLEGPVDRAGETVAEPAPPVAPPVAPAPPAARRPAWILPGIAILVIGAALLAWKFGSSDVAPDVPFRVVPVTRLPGKEYQPALAPGGKQIAFLSAEDGTAPPSVWVQDVDGSNARQVSKAGGHHSSPAWSPDGTSLAFLRVQRTFTEVIVAGKEERIAARLEGPSYGYDYRMLDWSPDGQWLMVSHRGLVLIDAGSGERKELTRPAEGAAGDVDPRFLPDGSGVSFLRLLHRAQQEIFTLPLTGGEPKQITKFGKRISAHDWAGKSIVFASDRGGDFRLWRESAPLGIYSEFPIQFSIARKGGALAYSTLQQDRNIWRLDLESLTWKRLIASSGQDASPQYSPAGDRICFRSDRSGEEQLWVANADGGGAVRVTRASTRPSVGRWSPDASSIVFNTPETGEIFVASSRDGVWTVRDTGARGVHPVFSPDGKEIYAGGSAAIVRAPAAGGPTETVMAIKAEALSVSPDGKYLYFVREPDDTSLWRADLRTRAMEKVLDGLVPACTSCWAAADDGVYFLGSDSDSFDKQILYFHDLRTRQDRAVVPYPEPLWPLGSGPFSLSPDGRSLLCVRVAPSSSDAMLVTPFPLR